jgi:hypothetical protein
MILYFHELVLNMKLMMMEFDVLENVYLSKITNEYLNL